MFDCDPMVIRSGHRWYPPHREKVHKGQRFWIHRCARCATRVWSDQPHKTGRGTLAGFHLYLVSAAP